MRLLLIGVVAAVLGIAAAWGTTQYEFRHGERPVPLHDHAASSDPKLEIEQPTFDFGVMQAGETQERTFVIRNAGRSSLSIKAGRPSCGCVTVHFKDQDLAPGESCDFLVSWKPTITEENFRKTVPVHSNDPLQSTVDLVITGHVRNEFKMEPETVPLGNFSPTESNTYTVKVWGFRKKPWRFESYTCVDSQSAEFFEVEAQEMPADVLEQLPGALNGQLLKLVVKPGLSLGNVQQKLQIHYRDTEPGTVDLPVTGKAVGDITVIGRDYNSSGEYVDLGNISVGSGKKSSLSLLVKGAHRDQVKLRIKEVDPAAALKAELGEPIKLGNSLRWPLTVEIPSDAQPINRLGSELGRMARIEFETDTPEVPDFAVKLRFSVTP